MMARFQSGASEIRDSTPQGSQARMEFGREICCSLANVFCSPGMHRPGLDGW